MNAPNLDQIAQAVLAWQRRHPLALRLDARAVHSIGLVALPFLKPQSELMPPAWRRLLARLRGESAAGRPAFRQRFVDTISVAAAARFALQHGVDAVEGADDWPQRRIEVDDELALASGWPYERWLATAAIEGPQGRERVLVSLAGAQTTVLGRRLLDRQRLMLAAALLAGLAVATALLLRGEPAPAPELRVVGAVQPASAASTAAGHSNLPQPAPPTSVSSAPLQPASAASSVASEPSESPPPLPTLPASSEAPFDIRPRLGPVREGPRPPLGGGSAPRSAVPAATVATNGMAAGPAAVAASAAPTPSVPAATATQPSRPLRIEGPVVALVSQPYAKRAEAEAMLARMQSHLAQTLPAGKALEHEIFETPQGYRAALWPFASREEAQILNATMIARGWRTRAVDF